MDKVFKVLAEELTNICALEPREHDSNHYHLNIKIIIINTYLYNNYYAQRFSSMIQVMFMKFKLELMLVSETADIIFSQSLRL